MVQLNTGCFSYLTLRVWWSYDSEYWIRDVSVQRHSDDPGRDNTLY